MRVFRPCGIPALLIILILLASAEACAMRPRVDAAPRAPAVSVTPVPTAAVKYSVRFLLADQILSEQTVTAGEFPLSPDSLEGAHLLGWTTENGEPIVPGDTPVTGDTVYLAVARPILEVSGPILFPNEYGLLCPEDPFTAGDALRAVTAFLPDRSWLDAALTRWEQASDQPLTTADLSGAIQALFPPSDAERVFSLLPEEEHLTRAQAACILTDLLDLAAAEPWYYPDAAPDRPDIQALLAASAPGVLTPEALEEQTKDGFLWFGGYLYRLDERGYFVTDSTVDSLYYDGNGRYTCGNAELDDYVAQTILEYAKPENTRLEDLHALYYHVKNDFNYLRRNYYASGETGWDTEEALTIFRTNKGNCYCYAGAFCALARGMGYNAVTYSGTIGVQEQPHAWTEITLDDQIYICDPEIEMNYWVWLKEYTDNFMMRREKSAGWNYIAVGRTVQYE